MHSIIMIACGIVTLAVFVALGSLFGSDRRATMARAILIFIPLWLLVALANMYVGVANAGYTVFQELPFLLLVFGVPAVLALILRRCILRQRSSAKGQQR